LTPNALPSFSAFILRVIRPGSRIRKGQKSSGTNSFMEDNLSNHRIDGGQASRSNSRPLLIYDGECKFCVFWARYWQKLTGSSVDYKPYQEVGAQYPNISAAEFRRAVQYIASDGSRSSAAKASFLALSHTQSKTFWLALYNKLPGFAALSEIAYAFISAHRSAFYRITLCLWGKDYTPPQYDFGSYVFQRLLGLIYLCAFISFGVQARGLIGSHGILPLENYVAGMSESNNLQLFFQMPMVFWLNASDLAVQIACWVGVAASLFLTFNILPRLCLCLVYLLYLSLAYAGQTFMNYQWDSYLLETGVLALILSFSQMPGIWLLRWLLFRFMFMSGMVKLLSGDANWWNLSALSYHFLTQPLPTPLAW